MRKADEAKLKEHAVQLTTYFKFREKDEDGKTDAKRKADAEAARIEKLTGVKMEVAEGCFL